MRFYLISDNLDTLTGMRLAGIPGEIVHTAEETQRAVKAAVGNPDIGIILITTGLASMCSELITQIRMTVSDTLITEIPDRHSNGTAASSLTKYVNDAIGIGTQE